MGSSSSPVRTSRARSQASSDAGAVGVADGTPRTYGEWQAHGGRKENRPLMTMDEGTIEPATLGSTPSSADDVDPPGRSIPPVGPKQVSTWPMWLLGFVIMVDQ